MAGSRKPRDYAAEYERRIAHALEKGYSRSQARGHARVTKGEARIKGARHDLSASTIERVKKALKLIAGSSERGSKKKAYKEAGISESTVKRYLKSGKVVFELTKTSFFEKGTGLLIGAAVAGDSATKLGKYHNAIRLALSEKASWNPQEFEGEKGRVITVSGKKYQVENDLQKIKELQRRAAEMAVTVEVASGQESDYSDFFGV